MRGLCGWFWPWNGRERNFVNEPLAILERLLRHRVEFVLVGGQAAAVHGVTLVTRDVDVCLPFSSENLARLRAALADLHPVHRITPQALPFQPADFEPGTIRNLYLNTDLGTLDCLGEIAGVGPFDVAARRTIEIDLPFGRCRVLDLEAMIEAKSALDRDQDKLALIQLKAIRDRPRS